MHTGEEMKDIIEMAKAVCYPLMVFDGRPYVSPELERLVALVRADEREECAKVCDSLEEQCEKLLVPDEKWPTPSDCAHIIRARGNT